MECELEPEPDLVEAVRTGHHRLQIVSVERIRDELKFDTIPMLVAEMTRDKERARSILTERR